MDYINPKELPKIFSGTHKDNSYGNQSNFSVQNMPNSLEESPTIFNLNADDFSNEGKISSRLPSDLVFLMFGANWCGHCQNLKPIILDVSKSMKNQNIIIALMECGESKNQQKLNGFTDFKIMGFPTLVLFDKGRKIDIYSGNRTQRDIENYLLKQIDKRQNKLSVYSSSLF